MRVVKRTSPHSLAPSRSTPRLYAHFEGVRFGREQVDRPPSLSGLANAMDVNQKRFEFVNDLGDIDSTKLPKNTQVYRFCTTSPDFLNNVVSKISVETHAKMGLTIDSAPYPIVLTYADPDLMRPDDLAYFKIPRIMNCGVPISSTPHPLLSAAQRRKIVLNEKRVNVRARV